MSEWPISVPRETVNDDFVVLVRWLVDEGAFVERGTPVCEIETSKAVVVIEADQQGYVVRQAQQYDQVAVGAPVGVIRAAQAVETVAKPAAEVRNAAQTAAAGAGGGTVTFSRKAEELVRRLALDPQQFAGRGLVREKDVLEAANVRPSQAPAPAPPTAKRKSRAEVGQVITLDPAKRTEIRYLTEASQVLMSAVTALLRTGGLDRRIASDQSRRLTYVDFIVPAAAARLREYPELNAFVAGNELHAYAAINVGVAVNLGKGLMVPVLRNADRLAPDETSRSIGDLAMRYLRGELAESDLIQGTFTVTDLSGSGVFQVLPRINRDQTSILAIGRDAALPGLLTLTLAFDHRATDGQRAGQFLADLKADLEQGDASAPAVEAARACDQCLLDLEGLRTAGVGSFLVPIIRDDGSRAHLCSICLLGWNG